MFAALIISCSDPEPLISPTHFNRVPRPVNITALSDTTVTGKFKITLNWSVNSEENLKDFSILRAFQIKKTNQVTFNATTLNYTKQLMLILQLLIFQTHFGFITMCSPEVKIHL